jgi:acetyl esterase
VGAEGPLPARLYVPETLSSNHLILFFHGGGFVLGGIGTHGDLCRWLAHTAGMRVLAATYRLAPEHKFPAQLDDALAICRHVQARAGEGEVAHDRLILCGDSAGAYLSARCAIALNGERAGAVALQVLLYPLVRLDDAARGLDLVLHPRPIWRTVVRYIDRSLGNGACPSLLDDDHTHAPPTLVVVGGLLDPIRPDSDVFCEALRARGVNLRELRYPALAHGELSITKVSSAAVRVLKDTGAAIVEELSAQAASPR